MEFLKKHQFTVLYVILAFFSLVFLVQKTISKDLIFAVSLFLIVLILEIVIFLLLKKMMKQEYSLEKVYLPIAIVLGLIYLFAFPFSQLPDEKSDYLRSLEVANFHATSVQKYKTVGREFSTNIDKVYSSKSYNDMKKSSGLKLNDETKFYAFSNKSLYAFVCYIPQALGIGISSFLGFSIVLQGLIGKIFNYTFFVILMYLSIKYIPFKKMLVFFIALLPMTLQEAVSLSPDAMTISVSIALISFILYFRNGTTQKLKLKHFIILSLLAIILSLCKIVYLPLCFLIFLIPKERFKSNKQKYLFCSILSLIVIIVNLAWLNVSSQYLGAFESRSNAGDQLKYILSNPIYYIGIIFNTIDAYAITYLGEMVGKTLGNFNVETSSIMTIVSLGVLFYLISKTKGKKNWKDFIFSLKEKIFIILVILGTILLMFTSLYIQWTAVYSNIIDGIQGRYFIPILLIISMLWMHKNEVKSKNEDFNIAGCSVLTNIMALVAIFVTFI